MQAVVQPGYSLSLYEYQTEIYGEYYNLYEQNEPMGPFSLSSARAAGFAATGTIGASLNLVLLNVARIFFVSCKK